MKKNPRRQKSQTSKASALPFDLQMIVRTAFADNMYSEPLFKQFAQTDAAVMKALASRRRTRDDDLCVYSDRRERKDLEASEDYRLARAAIAHYFASGLAKEEYTTPDGAAEDVLDTLLYAVRETAFAFGLVLGYRLTRAAGGAR